MYINIKILTEKGKLGESLKGYHSIHPKLHYGKKLSDGMKRSTEYWYFEKRMNLTILQNNVVIQAKHTFNRIVS